MARGFVQTAERAPAASGSPERTDHRQRDSVWIARQLLRLRVGGRDTAHSLCTAQRSGPTTSWIQSTKRNLAIKMRGISDYLEQLAGDLREDTTQNASEHDATSSPSPT